MFLGTLEQAKHAAAIYDEFHKTPTVTVIVRTDVPGLGIAFSLSVVDSATLDGLIAGFHNLLTSGELEGQLRSVRDLQREVEAIQPEV